VGVPAGTICEYPGLFPLYLFTLGMLLQCFMENMENTSRDLFPGALEMMILESLRRQPAHGYALVQHIQQRSNNLLQVEEGSLYPALQRLLKAKQVRAQWTISPSTNRRVRIYEITRAGMSHLEREISSFDRMLEGIQMVLGPKRREANS
jgi:PadR family transcriptional regulator, regulatory protein PadR